MEPRPPKRPRPSQPSAGNLYGSQPRSWELQTGGSQPNQAPGAAGVPEQGAFGPTSQGTESLTGVEFPIAPKSQRGHRWLGPLLAAILLAAVVGGVAWAVTKALDGDDKRDNIVAVSTPIPPAATEGAVAPTLPPAPTETSEPEATEPPAEATEPPDDDEAAATEEPAEAAQSDASDSEDGDEAQGTARYVPEAAVIGEGFAETEEGGERTKEEVAIQIATDESAGVALLDEWGWQENLFQSYEIPPNQVDPNAAKFASVSVHRFDSEEGAAAALDYLADIVVESQGLTDGDAPDVGDDARALAGPGEGVNLYVLYVRDGRYLIRLGGAADTGDPAPVIDELAENLTS